ncbi:MAG: hypothetical protein J0M07_20310 [Anaerolineae bacterium]|nr:hypothetical protein [Anaerolineae bacterium]
MTDTVNLPKGAIIVHDLEGKEYILIPSEQYEQVENQEKSQITRIMEVLDSLEHEPGDDEWWEEFRQYLKDNPVIFNEPPDNLADDE